MIFVKSFRHFVISLPRSAVTSCIKIYQKILSPDHSFWGKRVFSYGHCKFTPSCSEYMRLAIEKYGIVRGLPQGLWRICRCNPWTVGGEDLP